MTMAHSLLMVVSLRSDYPDFESKSSYSIRLQSQDLNGLVYEKPFTLNVIDQNEASTDLSISAATLNEGILMVH